MAIIAVDLGTTNIKVAIYSDDMQTINIVSHTVTYQKSYDWVEFIPSKYFEIVLNLLRECIKKTPEKEKLCVHQIVLTGQAESLVVVDKHGKPVRNGISWLDMRSRVECEELSSIFNADKCFRITGQPNIIPTWPITKMLWIKKHEPEVYARAAKYLMLKDYILYRLTGKFAGEHSIYNFTHYFNIVDKQYWEDPLKYCGIQNNQLPDLVEPCTVLGTLLPEIAKSINIHDSVQVNVGALDHFAGMIATGNIRSGIISESAGTVLSIATLLDTPLFSPDRIPVHCGPFPDSYVLLPVCESGGISLEWFKNNFAENFTYNEINAEASLRTGIDGPIFLPFIIGSNAPDFNVNASGVFFGIQASHDRFDFALSVMEGVSCLLKRNIDFFKKAGINADRIISTGGGSKSVLWSQLKADYTDCIVEIPENEEAPCLGAAMIGAVSAGIFQDYQAAVNCCVKIKTQYTPSKQRSKIDKKYRLFEQIYSDLQPSFMLHKEIKDL